MTPEDEKKLRQQINDVEFEHHIFMARLEMTSRQVEHINWLEKDHRRVRADLAAANERERKMLEIPEVMPPAVRVASVIHTDREDAAINGANAMRDKFRAILTSAGKSASTEKEPKV